MPHTLPFTKMHGLGNDFIVIDHFQSEHTLPITPALAQLLCHRRIGVGADQILWLKKSHLAQADFRLEILNADGSAAEMCGNGIRAVVKYLHKYHTPMKTNFQIETLTGLKTAEILNAEWVKVEMGIPLFSSESKKLIFPLMSEMPEFDYYDVNVGNPHAVIFIDSPTNLDELPLETFGPLIENHKNFPARTNVEFVTVLNSSEIQVRVWERGAGITLACGTGACAAAVAALSSNEANSGAFKGVQSPLHVRLPGGTLQIEWKGQGHPIFMHGPATEVFRGEFEISYANTP